MVKRRKKLISIKKVLTKEQYMAYVIGRCSARTSFAYAASELIYNYYLRQLGVK